MPTPLPHHWLCLILLLQGLHYAISGAEFVSSRLRGHHNRGYTPVKLHPCEQSSCYPATGNLLIGREEQLYASSTCGLHEQQRYCIVSHLEDRKKCFWCDSRATNKPNPHLNHNISNIVYRMYPGTRHKSWWQSENGKEKVHIQLDLEAEFHFTHLIIKFKTFRPAAMLIERSYDFRKTWHVYRYFAANCAESFPNVPAVDPHNLTDVVCESRYSYVAPTTEGEVIYRVLPPQLRIDNPYSEHVQNLLKMTNLRINFTKLHTLGDDLLDRRQDIQEKYYYAITDMVVRGSCSCYGHANRCLPLPGIDPKPDMVHGRCECTHNTKGRNCEKCEDFYNDLPWRPAIGKQTNACKKCNCNNHATSCHYDAALYEATGRVSGGMCDECQHNTMGPNCNQCKPFYYRDPNRDMQDPEICRPCDCDPRGSLDGGICDSITDASNELEAGSCHCKRNVMGRRCDSCKNGYWNFTEVNPDGCQNCTCNTFGTIDNQGCNVYTGECTCKRYVTGRDCNQCLPEYWGLSEKRDGCQSCDCDPGGSFDNYCDVITGQCRCREHMDGRTCNEPKQQHFTASIDFLLYEAELARASPNCQVVIRESYRDGRPQTWTGAGFMKAYETSYLEFMLDGIKTSMPYEIIVRYEPMMPNSWNEVDVKLERPGPIDMNGPCAKYVNYSDSYSFSLPSNDRSLIVHPPVCLEAGLPYKVHLSFRRYDVEKETPSAAVLIDSLVLMPTIEAIPWFYGSVPAEARRREFERERCDTHSIASLGAKPEKCKTYFNSIGAYAFGAYPCQCNPTGSVSKLCEEYGGSCLCKPNVVGRRCDRCSPGTFGFGPEGCKACDCNSIGALDNFCNATTGQCKCRANTYGRECNQCRTGFWNFPNCQRCECNGHADICESRTGVCLHCRDNTFGHNCDICTEGFYGDPRLNADIPCRPCPCPGIPGSNNSFAQRCALDPYRKDVVCECQEGYSGDRCDLCAENYFGNPQQDGGHCQPCDCNDKIDLMAKGNCDPLTGQCKQCLYETTGDHCEVCRNGYFRYNDDQMCEECVCHILGTNSSAGPCDPNSGQCACLPNVTGLNCDQCISNHWKIASGEGCEACNCDPQGSLRSQCNEFDGQCECKDGFGGRECNECTSQHFGDPKGSGCQPCECDVRGSKTLQCNMQTGACLCIQGIGGYKCDQCARGYLGQAPDCMPCGECFDNWDRILDETQNRTLSLIERAKDIKKVGATGAYSKEFDDIQSQLNAINAQLELMDQIDADAIADDVEQLRRKLKESSPDSLDATLGNTQEQMLITNLKLNDLQKSINLLKNRTKELEINGTQLQEGNVQGALSLVQSAKEKADRAAHRAERTELTIQYADRQCKATETYLNDTAERFRAQLEENREQVASIRSQLERMGRQLPDMNALICDGHGDPCDSICGGAGCSSCANSISCENGAKHQAETALSLANDTEAALRHKETIVNDFIRNVSQIHTNATKQIATQAFNKAQQMLHKTNTTLHSAINLQKDINDFLSQNTTTPADIKQLAEQVLSQKIHLEPDEIADLAEKIKTAVVALTSIDLIIEETRDDIREVNQLKDDAELAKLNANEILTDAAKVNNELENTTRAQNDAQNTIQKASTDIQTLENVLTQIKESTENAQNQTNTTAQDIQKLSEQLNTLQRNITDNGIYANRVVNESANILQNAKQTYDNFNTLQVKYTKAKQDLDLNLVKVESIKERANALFNRAIILVAKVTNTEDNMNKMNNNGPGEHLVLLEKQMDDLIRQMNGYSTDLEKRVQHYKICN